MGHIFKMANRGKEVVADEKRKRIAPRTTVWMDFDPKPSILSNQKDVDNYLTRHHGRLPSTIAVELCPAKTDMKVEPPAGGLYFHPMILALGGFAASDPICLKCVGVLSGSSHSVGSGRMAAYLGF